MPAKLLAFLWFGSTGGFCGAYEDSGCGTGVPVYHPYTYCECYYTHVKHILQLLWRYKVGFL